MDRTLTAFSGDYWIATGDEDEVRAALRAMGDDAQNILLFDDRTGRQVDCLLYTSTSPRDRTRSRMPSSVISLSVTKLRPGLVMMTFASTIFINC